MKEIICNMTICVFTATTALRKKSTKLQLPAFEEFCAQKAPAMRSNLFHLCGHSAPSYLWQPETSKNECKICFECMCVKFLVAVLVCS